MLPRPENLSQHSLFNTHSQTVYRRSKPPSQHSQPPPPPNITKRHKPAAPPSTRDGTELQEGELYLDNLACDDDQWPKMVKWALTHKKQRVKSANEVPEAEHPKPCIKVKQETVSRKCSGIAALASLPTPLPIWSRSSVLQI